MNPSDPSDSPRLLTAVDNARVLAEALAAHAAVTDPWTEPSIRTDLRGGVRRLADEFDQGRSGRRVAVVCWDLSHNPAGRALVLANLHREAMRVDLVGPLWSRFGTSVWEPLLDAGHSTVTFQCDRLADFAAKAYALAAHRRYDLVHVCKPRLPGVVLGSLIARANDCPIVIDIDDEEQAFFSPDDLRDADPEDPAALDEPTEAAGTKLGIELARGARARTVSNVELRREYGGVMVRHARSEHTFDPAAVSRSAGRERLGAAEEDFVVLFVGTPRPHKGLSTVVDALRRLDDRFVLHVVGVTNRARFDEEVGGGDVRIVTHPPTDMAILPELLSAGDAIALMQDLDDPIAEFQIPSKISDALSMGVPVIVSNVPPLRDLQDHGLLRADDAEELAAALGALAEGEAEGAAGSRRRAFLAEFSGAVNAARISAAAGVATTAREAGEDEIVTRTIEALVTTYRAGRRGIDPGRHIGESGTDLVVFWKQNDTGLYGRRTDMLTEYLARDPRIRQVLHLDAPIGTEAAWARSELPDGAGTEHQARLASQLLDRRLGVADHATVTHRTFVHGTHTAAPNDPLTGMPTRPREDYAAWVREEMAALGMTPQTAVAWVCPVVADFADVHRQLGFRRVVLDLIDDERALDLPRDRIEEIDASYREVVGLADRVFTNCRPVADAFASLAGDITVVPNGAETSAFDRGRAELGDDTRPVVAYVGHLSDRIDWALLADVAELRPDTRFLLAGAAHPQSPVYDLADRFGNVEFVGLIPYSDLPEFLRGVDVGIVAHLAGPMTDRMNPLKAYNYHAAGLPIVSTEIANLDELAAWVTVATDPRAFAAAVDAGVLARREGRVHRDEALLTQIDWTSRAGAVLDRLEQDGIVS